MLKKIKVFLIMYSAVIICGIVTVAAPLILHECEIFWYQEKEPEGLEAFVENNIKINRFSKSNMYQKNKV